MSAAEWAAVIGSVAGIILVVGLLFALRSLVQTMGAVRTAVEELRTQTVPLVSDLQATVRQANAELARADNLLETAESISGTVDAASRLAYLAFSNPVVKALAFAAGTGRAAKRLRRGREH